MTIRRRSSTARHPGSADPAPAPDQTEVAQAWRVVLTALKLPRICPRKACRRSQACLPTGRRACLHLDDGARAWVIRCLTAQLDDELGSDVVRPPR